MNAELAALCYRLALRAAERRNISGAALYARHACLLDEGHADAPRLLGLCLYELGEPEAERYFPEEFPASSGDGLDPVRSLATRKKWRAAARAAGSLPRQSARVLNIQGCLFALAKRYARAADCFAKALAQDSGSALAAAGLAETAGRRGRFWEIL